LIAVRKPLTYPSKPVGGNDVVAIHVRYTGENWVVLAFDYFGKPDVLLHVVKTHNTRLF
jgi:hypothetical protein